MALAQQLAIERNPTRRGVAELFGAVQERPEHDDTWQAFSQSFVFDGLQSVTDGLHTQGRRGLHSVQPSRSHKALADLLAAGLAYAVSLNFDGLEYKALRAMQDRPEDDRPRIAPIVVDNDEQVYRFFAARVDRSDDRLVPVFHIRGDVFFANCKRSECPLAEAEFALYRIARERGGGLRCPICGGTRFRLRFSFPGRREKEELAWPMLWSIRRFLNTSISSIIMVGLSGRWDEYLLRYIFEMALEYDISVYDVRPSQESADHVVMFRRSYYPSLQERNEQLELSAAYIRVEATADQWLPLFSREMMHGST